MTHKYEAKKQLRQTFLQEYLNSNTFRSPRKDPSAERPNKKSCVNKLTPQFAKAKLRENSDQENTYETNESYHVPEEEASASSNRGREILSEVNLRRHTTITNTTHEDKRNRTLIFIEKTEQERRSENHTEQIKVTAEQFQRTYENEKRAVEKRKNQFNAGTRNI